MYVGYQALIPLSVSVIHKLLLLTLAHAVRCSWKLWIEGLGGKEEKEKKSTGHGRGTREGRGSEAENGLWTLWLAAELCYLLTRFFEQTRVVLGTLEFASIVSSFNPEGEGEGERPGGRQHQCIQASLMTLKMPLLHRVCKPIFVILNPLHAVARSPRTTASISLTLARRQSIKVCLSLFGLTGNPPPPTSPQMATSSFQSHVSVSLQAGDTVCYRQSSLLRTLQLS